MTTPLGMQSQMWLLRDVSVSLDDLTPQTELEYLRMRCARQLGISSEAVRHMTVMRESLDARKRGNPSVVYSLLVDSAEAPIRLDGAVRFEPPPSMTSVLGEARKSFALRPVVVGTGPCGLFSALVLAEAGVPPLLLERGQPVEKRQEDVARHWLTGIPDLESNVQFGEGGAGTFSDGKLTTRINDPRCRKVLETFVACGAPEEILYLAKPHIGTDRLRVVLTAMRKRLLELGTEIRFGAKMDRIHIRNGLVNGLRLCDGSEVDASHLILAIGHSARDTFSMLRDCGVVMEAKPFSAGVRIEHLQKDLDGVRYGGLQHYKLKPSEYQLFERGKDRTVYTFCMCPGGVVVAAASEPDSIVTNGMSHAARAGLNANSAWVVSVSPADFGSDPMDGILFQRQLEHEAYRLGGGNGAAPVQRLADFLSSNETSGFGKIHPTYTGPFQPASLQLGLPKFMVERLQASVQTFNRRLPGFADPDAILTGYETRTSSPIRLLRGSTLEAEGIRGLYPAGEGAGYAGGIMSAAVDGIRVAEAVLGGCEVT